MNWFKYTYPELEKNIFHFANERKCSQIEGGILKRMGVQAGVADVFLAHPSNGYPGLWIEIKAGKNSLSAAQKDFLKRMESAGFATAVGRGLEECKEAIIDYLKKS
jgi:hypothetical protein